MTNQTELQLRKADKSNMVDLTNKLARVFMPIKCVLAGIIDAHFPEFNYATKELETYQEELEARNADQAQKTENTEK